MKRRRFLGVAASALAGALALPTRGIAAARLLSGVRIGNGGRPFARDRAMLTTLGPSRPTARLHFTLLRRSRVSLQVLQTGSGARSVQRVPGAQPPPAERAATLEVGAHELRWTPPAALPPRTY